MNKRPIKFRASYKPEWGEVRVFKVSSIDWEENLVDGEIPLHCLNLMQFTGLTDKNGKEIYEGDIVSGVVKAPQLLTGDNDENCNTKMCGKVFWNWDRFSLEVIQHMSDKEREGMANFFDFDNGAFEGSFDEREVIGNIYENPELLNK